MFEKESDSFWKRGLIKPLETETLLKTMWRLLSVPEVHTLCSVTEWSSALLLLETNKLTQILIRTFLAVKVVCWQTGEKNIKPGDKSWAFSLAIEGVTLTCWAQSASTWVLLLLCSIFWHSCAVFGMLLCQPTYQSTYNRYFFCHTF